MLYYPLYNGSLGSAEWRSLHYGDVMVLLLIFPFLDLVLGRNEWTGHYMNTYNHLQNHGDVRVCCFGQYCMTKHCMTWDETIILCNTYFLTWDKPFCVSTNLIALYVRSWFINKLIIRGLFSLCIHLISPGCPRPGIALQVHNRGHFSSVCVVIALRPPAVATSMLAPSTQWKPWRRDWGGNWGPSTPTSEWR